MTMNSHALKKLIKKSASGTFLLVLIGFSCGISAATMSSATNSPVTSPATLSTTSDATNPTTNVGTLPSTKVNPPPATTTATPLIPNNTALPATSTMNSSLPVNQPNMKNDDILNFAKTVVISVYSYDFKNYKNQIAQNQRYFTSNGWKAFEDALNKSNNLKTVESKKLVASASVNGNPTLLEQGVKNGRYTWKVHVPLLATYENETKFIKQNLSVTLLINRTNTGQGVGISHFIAEMVLPNTQTQSNTTNPLSPVNTPTNRPTNQTDVPAPMSKTPGQMPTTTNPTGTNMQNSNPTVLPNNPARNTD